MNPPARRRLLLLRTEPDPGEQGTVLLMWPYRTYPFTLLPRCLSFITLRDNKARLLPSPVAVISILTKSEGNLLNSTYETYSNHEDTEINYPACLLGRKSHYHLTLRDDSFLDYLIRYHTVTVRSTSQMLYAL